MLDRTNNDQGVWIYLVNSIDQNMPVFKGTVEAAKKVTYLWPYLMVEVSEFQCTAGILVIKIKNDNYEKTCLSAQSWGELEKRPWKYTYEINEELKRRQPYLQDNGVLVVPANGNIWTRTRSVMLDPGPGLQYCRMFVEHVEKEE